MFILYEHCSLTGGHREGTRTLQQYVALIESLLVSSVRLTGKPHRQYSSSAYGAYSLVSNSVMQHVQLLQTICLDVNLSTTDTPALNPNTLYVFVKKNPK